MRVLQLIDSLRPGGAERMAVTYANALNGRIEASYLCCTRLEGKLRKNLAPGVGYLFLKKKSALDIKAIFRLRRYIKDNKITIIQAHSTSFFLAVLVKISLPEVKLVWHDHFGKEIKARRAILLRPASKYFDAVISVNSDLKKWAIANLHSSEVEYIMNFIPEAFGEIIGMEKLKGSASFNIVCLANFRAQKDHTNLLQAFLLIHKENLNLHLIGSDNNNSYSETIKKFLHVNNLKAEVFIYGARENVDSLLKQADLGVLSSSSEGLPVALLEYGFAGLPVVCTRVGQCSEVIGKYGLLVPPRDPQALAGAIQVYLEDGQKRSGDSRKFRERILKNYSEEVVIPEVLRLFEKILKS